MLIHAARAVRFGCVALILFVAPPPARAQLQLAAIDGLVTGPDGVALEGATVRFRSVAIGWFDDGATVRFRFADVQHWCMPSCGRVAISRANARCPGGWPLR